MYSAVCSKSGISPSDPDGRILFNSSSLLELIPAFSNKVSIVLLREFFALRFEPRLDFCSKRPSLIILDFVPGLFISRDKILFAYFFGLLLTDAFLLVTNLLGTTLTILPSLIP